MTKHESDKKLNGGFNDGGNVIEVHPFEPFVDESTRLLIMGTFPPPTARWSMNFYYPNRINDFWYMMGVIFFNDRYALYDKENNVFKLEEIKKLLKSRHIGLNDTGYKVRRLKGNASDKFLEIIEPIPLQKLLLQYKNIQSLCTTGEKAASVISLLTDTEVPAIGHKVKTEFQLNNGTWRSLNIWRMPSTSRAYPLALEKKAAFYADMFRSEGIIC